MALNYAVPTPLGYFSTLVQSDDEFPLLEAAASLAQDDHPTLDMQQVLNEVDQLLSRLTQRVASNAPAVQRLQVLNRFFYGDLGFDTLILSSVANGTVVNLLAGTVTSGATIQQIGGFERVFGTASSETFIDSAAATILYAGAGNDIMNGQGGNDSL